MAIMFNFRTGLQCLVLVLSAFLFQSIEANLVLRVTCDNNLVVFVDGVSQQSDDLNDWTKEKTFSIPNYFKTLAFECLNTGGPEGILASVEDSTGKKLLITDKNWKCSNTKESGWEQINFDNSWQAASVKGDHGDAPWGMIGQISGSAKWIWTSGTDSEVYCRTEYVPCRHTATDYLGGDIAGSKVVQVTEEECIQICLSMPTCVAITFVSPNPDHYTAALEGCYPKSGNPEWDVRTDPRSANMVSVDITCLKEYDPCRKTGTDYLGGDIAGSKVVQVTEEECIERCLSITGCIAITFVSPNPDHYTAALEGCYPKSGDPEWDVRTDPRSANMVSVDMTCIKAHHVLRITCDNQLTVFVDGVLRHHDDLNNWTKESTFRIPNNFKTLALKCTNTGGPEGILASVEDVSGKIVLLTDGNWKCSNTEESGWGQTNFDNNWEAASVKADHGHTTWNFIGQISHSAKWIWTSGTDATVYCRAVVSQRPCGGATHAAYNL